MPENKHFPPEGLRPRPALSLQELYRAVECGTILEAVVQRCDAAHDLHIPLGSAKGILPRDEVLSPWVSGADRDISILSRVGKPTCFRIRSITADEKGGATALLTRRQVQDEALEWSLEHLRPGAVISAVVTHLEPFGVFADIGCGIVAMLPIEYISVSRIAHPADRFQVGQHILAAVRSVDRQRRRFTLTHKELLGTWLENASFFRPGETVQGIVRSVKEYGAFVELSPNLSGLADTREPLVPGERVSVYIRSIRPERMKIKLQVIDRLPPEPLPLPVRYRITDGCLDRWVYSPPGYEKAPVETVFQETC